MIISKDTTDNSVRSNSPSVCVVLGLCAIAAIQFAFYGRLLGIGNPTDPVLDYASFVWLALALVLWRVSPQRCWRRLLIVGALATVPSQVFAIVPAYRDWMRIPYLLVDSAAWPFVMVGVLGAATAAWRSGQRVAGAVGFGATLVVSVGASIIAARLAFYVNVAVPVVGLLVVGATVLAALTANDRFPGEPRRPTWRVTVACVVASLAPMLLSASWPFLPSDQYLLVVGSAVLGIALVAGAVAGLRVLVVGSVAGLLLSAMTSLNRIPGLPDFEGLTGGAYAFGGLAALAAGIAVSRSRAGTTIGVIGLAVVVLVLLVLLLLSVDPTAAPILLILLVIAAVPVLASLGTVLAESGDGPAAFVGLAIAVMVGLVRLAGHVRETATESPAVAAYLSAAVFLALAAVLTVFANRRFVQAGG